MDNLNTVGAQFTTDLTSDALSLGREADSSGARADHESHAATTGRTTRINLCQTICNRVDSDSVVETEIECAGG